MLFLTFHFTWLEQIEYADEELVRQYFEARAFDREFMTVFKVQTIEETKDILKLLQDEHNLSISQGEEINMLKKQFEEVEANKTMLKKKGIEYKEKV